MEPPEHLPDTLDVLIIGAGVSGIGAAYHLQKSAPDHSYAIVEARDELGGTWDLFRYPGIRSDSDMYTFGFTFKPWAYARALSPGQQIKAYLGEAAEEHGIARHIHFGHRVVRANWSSSACRWTVELTNGTDTPRTLTCRFLFSCGGYYSYEQAHFPEFEHIDQFEGEVIHPQFWKEHFDYANKRLIVIGSGATAVTLVPELARQASHVTLLQRSPTYIVSRPSVDPFARWMNAVFPAKLAFALVRWRNILGGTLTYALSRRFPRLIGRAIVRKIRKSVDSHIDVQKHFTPDYNPWDQRICLVPDGDLFTALNNGSASIVTAAISKFTPEGIELASGEHLNADAVITATGLKVEVFSGMTLSVDGQPVNPGDTYCYKGMMLNKLPNCAFSVGYTNASWTLKSELVARYVARLLNHMRQRQFDWCVPELPADGLDDRPLMDFSANYILRARHLMPKQGSRAPWKLYQNYLLDRISLGLGRLEDGTLRFGRATDEQP